MADQEKAIRALNLASETCKTAQAALSQIHLPPAPSEGLPSLTVLHKDLQSLLSLIYADATKLGLSLKPANPSWSASAVVLDDLSKHISAIVHCTTLFAQSGGATLAREISFLVADVVEALDALVSGFLSPNPPSDYIAKVGAVHEHVERGRAVVSKDNLDAVVKRWKLDTGCIEDALNELEETIANAGTGDDVDSGWDELGLEGGGSLDETDVERATKVQSALRRLKALHDAIHDKILMPLGASDIELNDAHLDDLVRQSSKLVSGADDLVNAADDEESLSAEATSFQQCLITLQNTLCLITPLPLENQVGKLNLNGEPLDGSSSTHRWLEASFQKLSTSIQELRVE